MQSLAKRHSHQIGLRNFLHFVVRSIYFRRIGSSNSATMGRRGCEVVTEQPPFCNSKWQSFVQQACRLRRCCHRRFHCERVDRNFGFQLCIQNPSDPHLRSIILDFFYEGTKTQGHELIYNYLVSLSVFRALVFEISVYRLPTSESVVCVLHPSDNHQLRQQLAQRDDMESQPPQDFSTSTSDCSAGRRLAHCISDFAISICYTGRQSA